jgi:hypothetical protein
MLGESYTKNQQTIRTVHEKEKNISPTLEKASFP